MTDIEIAQQNTMQDIYKIARKAGIAEEYLETYGSYKAKVDLKAVENKPRKGKLILVTAINPTKAGEGKSTVTVGLTDALALHGKKVVAALREPSMGPVFGIKGGATGGGYAQVMPMEDINLHFTGDMHAITSVNNLIAAMIDNHIYQGNELGFSEIFWKRCLDVNDRALRKVKVGEYQRDESFNITVASEVMAILCLSKDLKDFENRINNCILGFNKKENRPIYARELNCGGAAAILMKDAIKPNLVQTLEHTPVLIHGGPFANIAHGCNSIIATDMALRLGDYVVTEAGFGADLGAEKFLDIKCRYGDLQPCAVVVVATVRALKMHGEGSLEKGVVNLEKHLENIAKYNLPYVVAINKFSDDTQEELDFLYNWCLNHQHPVEICDVWARGGEGGLDLASRVLKLCQLPNRNFNFLYNEKAPIKDKVAIIAKEIYGAKDVIFTEQAQRDIEKIYSMHLNTDLPICMSKTPNSLSDQPKLLGRPTDFDITVREIRYSSGAGMIVPICGTVMTMPGLPKTPAACKMSIDEKGIIKGLF